MQKAKLDVLVTMFCYSGNGGYSAVLPQIANWWANTYHEMCMDERIGRIGWTALGDTPVTMVRNLAVKKAQAGNYDCLLIIDSDNEPDMYMDKDPGAKPFWKTSFDFLYKRTVEDNLPTVVCAPYCGPPPHPTRGGWENVYMFYWNTFESQCDTSGFSLEQYQPHEAAHIKGIKPLAAGPTGLCLYSMSAFDLMTPPYYSYEFTDEFECEKGSTEDVVNLRDISLLGWQEHNTDVVFGNWDAWAGHHKAKCVGRPGIIHADHIGKRLRDAAIANVESDDEFTEVDYRENLKGLDTPVEEFVPPPVEDPVGQRELFPDVEEPDDDDDDNYQSLHEGNGEDLTSDNGEVPMKKRLIRGWPVVSVGHMTPEADLECLTNLVEWLAQENPEKQLNIIEVGTWVGESALALEAGLGQRGGTVWCVDHFKGQKDSYKEDLEEDDLDDVAGQLGGPDRVQDMFSKNVGDKLGVTIKPIVGESLAIAKRLDSQDADLVFIDASHERVDVIEDIRAWIKHAGPKGIICGHDYNDKFPGVVDAVQETFGHLGIDVRIMGGTSIWVVSMEDVISRSRELMNEQVNRPEEPADRPAPVPKMRFDTSEGEVS